MHDISRILTELAIPFETHEHPAVFTCEEADRLRPDIEGGKNKSLFLRNKKGDVHYLVMLPSTKQADLKQLSSLLSEQQLSFASAERLKTHLRLTPGSVGPFGLINDIHKAVRVVIDNDLMKEPVQAFHPNRNTATTVLSTQDFKKFLAWCKNEVRFENL